MWLWPALVAAVGGLGTAKSVLQKTLSEVQHISHVSSL